MVVIPTKKAFASGSFTVVSAAPVTHDDPLSTKTTAYSLQEMLNVHFYRCDHMVHALSSILILLASITEGKNAKRLNLACNNSSNKQAKHKFCLLTLPLCMRNV